MKSSAVPVIDLAVRDTHRLIASRFSSTGTVLSRLSSAAGTVARLMELDDATNDRFLGEEGLLPGIGIHELVYGVRYAHIVNAAFTHASPTGGRFNSPTRGAWYCSLDRATSVAEIAFHKLHHLDEIAWAHEEVSTSDDYLADLTSPFHDLRENSAPSLTAQPSGIAPSVESSGSPQPSDAPPISASSSWAGSSGQPSRSPQTPGAPSMTASSSWVGSSGESSSQPPNPSPFARYLRPAPIPRCYARSQSLADRLLTRQSNGIVFPSVRRAGGTCVVCFRPALVYNVRRGARLELRLQRDRPFRPSQAREVPIPSS